VTPTRKKHKQISIPEAIAYTRLTLPFSIPTDISQIKALRENITLQTQGEAIEVSEEYPIPLLMIAFDVVHQTSPEMVLRLNSGKRILLFDHWGTPVLRNKDIYSVKTVTEHKKSKKFTPELTIDLGTIWKKTDTKDDALRTIKDALQETEKLTKPAVVTTLVGKAPALLFLLVQHSLYGKTGEIWYQEKSTRASVKINSYE
jgi:hypothetical protein